MIYTVTGREKISTVSASVGFTTAKIAPTTHTIYAIVQPTTQNIRFTIDGLTTPTATVGFQLEAGASCEVWGQEALNNFRMIEEAASAAVEVIYMGTKQ